MAEMPWNINRTAYIILKLFFNLLEKSMQFRIYSINDCSQIFRIIYEVNCVDVDDQKFAFGVAVNPSFVTLVKST